MSSPYDGQSTIQSVPGISGENTAGGTGVAGVSEGGTGVSGESEGGTGVSGFSKGGTGVSGTSLANSGIVGLSTFGYGVEAISTNGQGLYAKGGFQAGTVGQLNAAVFDGGVTVNGTFFVTGNINLPSGSGDCAEEFDVAEAAEVEPGTVMVLDRHGALQPSQQAYDKKVAGVISGAGDYRPGMILDKKESSEGRLPVALVGKVYCKVDAHYAPIEMGDLLTTSPTLGYAMKAIDPLKAFGAVIGKALRPLEAGQGLIPILVALQ